MTVVCALVSFLGAPAAQAAPAEFDPPAATAAQASYARSGEADGEPHWGLLGLAGLFGLVGLARKRRRTVVVDPLAAYPVMRATDTAQRPDPPAASYGMPAASGAQPPRQPAPWTAEPARSVWSPQTSQQPGGLPGSAPVIPDPAAYTPPPIPAQNRGAHERLASAPRPAPAPRSGAAFPSPQPTSVMSDGSIRLAPAPPLHANRLSPPNIDISGVPGMADAPPAEPRWPQHEYD